MIADMTIGWMANHAVQIHGERDFADAKSGDLHLVTPEASVIDQGQTLSDVDQDIDCVLRPQGGGYDIGADEVQ
jgi:hypothetical protein